MFELADVDCIIYEPKMAQQPTIVTNKLNYSRILLAIIKLYCSYILLMLKKSYVCMYVKTEKAKRNQKILDEIKNDIDNPISLRTLEEILETGASSFLMMIGNNLHHRLPSPPPSPRIKKKTVGIMILAVILAWANGEPSKNNRNNNSNNRSIVSRTIGPLLRIVVLCTAANRPLANLSNGPSGCARN